MKRIIPILVFLGVFLAAVSESSFAQFNTGGGPGGVASQNLSPYNNLFLGKNPAINYLSGVAPFTQTQRFDARSLYQNINSIRTFNLESQEEGIPVIPETGHPVRFLTYYPYYNLGITSSTQRSNLLYPFRPQPKYK